MKNANLENNSLPVNKTAARVIQQSSINDRFDTKKSEGESKNFFWEAPKPHVNLARSEVDLTGTKFGRFTVIGKLANKKWQVRCSCGNYSARKPKAINNPKNNNDCCEVCRELLYLKRNEARRRGYMNTTWDDL